MEQAHLPVRPHWRCSGCSRPWPCAPARRRLIEEAGDDWSARLSISLYLSMSLADAMTDLPGVEVGALHARMVGWFQRNTHLTATS